MTKTSASPSFFIGSRVITPNNKGKIVVEGTDSFRDPESGSLMFGVQFDAPGVWGLHWYYPHQLKLDKKRKQPNNQPKSAS